jgi:hypothetical protein
VYQSSHKPSAGARTPSGRSQHSLDAMSMLTREAATRHALKSGVAPSAIIAVQAATTQMAGRDLTFMLLPTPPTDPRDLEIWQHLSIVRNGTDDNLPSVADALRRIFLPTASHS